MERFFGHFKYDKRSCAENISYYSIQDWFLTDIMSSVFPNSLLGPFPRDLVFLLHMHYCIKHVVHYNCNPSQTPDATADDIKPCRPNTVYRNLMKCDWWFAVTPRIISYFSIYLSGLIRDTFWISLSLNESLLILVYFLNVTFVLVFCVILGHVMF